MDAMSGAPTDMTEPTDPGQSMAAAIRALSHEILSGERRMSWGDVRGRIRILIREGRPSPPERLQLLELYHSAVTMAERRFRPDPQSSRRLGYQRANDTLLFLLAEVRDRGDVDAGATLTSIIARELAAGRMQLGPYFNNLLSLVLERFPGGHDGDDGTPRGVAEDFPPPFSRPPASPPAPPSP
jgi:hypothetical protein